MGFFDMQKANNEPEMFSYEEEQSDYTMDDMEVEQQKSKTAQESVNVKKDLGLPYSN
jgi:hypothetical protein